jgi:hypothetical protein
VHACSNRLPALDQVLSENLHSHDGSTDKGARPLTCRSTGPMSDCAEDGGGVGSVQKNLYGNYVPPRCGHSVPSNSRRGCKVSASGPTGKHVNLDPAHNRH